MARERKTRGRAARILIAALVLLALASAAFAAAYIGLPVGKLVPAGSVRDFYYTLSSSTDPPVYHRYRFYEQGGKKYFYHEKREGDHFPLTESDITVSGTAELTEAQWESFLSCLEGGKVRLRRQTADSGRKGPFTYLYWTLDLSRIQEYSFGSYGARLEFEELCARLSGG